MRERETERERGRQTDSKKENKRENMFTYSGTEDNRQEGKSVNNLVFYARQQTRG